MWPPQYGDRTLEGAEAEVFAEALSSLLDRAFAEGLHSYDLGIESFDNLTFGQRISILVIIGNGLLRKGVPIVRLTAVLEGAIVGVFEHLKNKFALEIDAPEVCTSLREFAVAARTEMEAEEIPEPTCDDLGEWETEVAGLAEAILWDLLIKPS